MGFELPSEHAGSCPALRSLFFSRVATGVLAVHARPEEHARVRTPLRHGAPLHVSTGKAMGARFSHGCSASLMEALLHQWMLCFSHECFASPMDALLQPRMLCSTNGCCASPMDALLQPWMLCFSHGCFASATDALLHQWMLCFTNGSFASATDALLHASPGRAMDALLHQWMLCIMPHQAEQWTLCSRH
eukprot:1157582-Pelagomonas_calceolata.AAC.6